MGKRFCFLAGLLVMGWLVALPGCNSTTTSSSSVGLIFVTQGDNSVTPFGVALSDGVLTQGTGVPTETMPSAMVLAPSGNVLFVANQSSNSISAYTVNSDGSLTASSSSTSTNATATGCPATPAPVTTSTPVGLAIDSAGHLFVANLGVFGSIPGAISVFSTSGTTLTPVCGSPFPTQVPTATDSAPAAVAVTPNGKFLYVANQLEGTVASYSVDSSGAITEILARQPVGTAPSALTIVEAPNTTSPTGEFLYVANSGSHNISGFGICDQVLTTCVNPNQPDGSLTQIPTSPFPAQLGPSNMTATPDGKFLFVVQTSNQISEFKISGGDGSLVANTSASISTGLGPFSLAIRTGTSTVSTTGGTTNFLYVTNSGANSLSLYSYDSTLGVLGLNGHVVSTTASPMAIVAK
jgi:6-phosphogluconolactonase